MFNSFESGMFLVNPYVHVPPVSYLVDDYSPTVAYSLRKISSTATNAIRVRRSSDNTEQDIGFNGTELDSSALATFVGANDGFVVKWYNQGAGGATYDAAQASSSAQPRIVSSGAIYTVNSKPSVFFDIASQGTPMTMASSFTYKTAWTLAKVDQENLVNYVLGNDSPASGLIYRGSFSGINGISANDGTNINGIFGEDLNQHLAYFNMRDNGSGDRLFMAIDGAAETNTGVFGSSLTSNLLGGRAAINALYFYGKIQEVILFSTDEHLEKTNIEIDINTYYGIY